MSSGLSQARLGRLHRAMAAYVDAGEVPGNFESHGWGFGVSVVIRRDSVATSPGQFGWSGAFDTTWITDPREQLVAILMAQRMAFGPSPTGIRPDFCTSVYQGHRRLKGRSRS